MSLLGALLLLMAAGATAEGPTPTSQSRAAALAKDGTLRLRLDANHRIPDGTADRLQMGIAPVPGAVAVNASLGVRAVAADAPQGDASYAAGDEFDVTVRFTGPVYVLDPELSLALGTGCHDADCFVPEVQSLYCEADTGQFRLLFDDEEVSVNAQWSPAEVEYAMVAAFSDVREVAVEFSGARGQLSTEASTWSACAGEGNNITVTFLDVDRFGPGEHGDLPALQADRWNSIIDPHSLDRIASSDSWLARYAGGDVVLSENATEVVRGERYNDRVAAYASGNGTDTLTFHFVVQDGDFADDLDYANQSALVDGRIVSAADGLPVDATLPPLGWRLDSIFSEAASLAAQRDVVIDTTPAALTQLMTPLPDGKYGVAQEVPIIVNFSRPIVLSVPGTQAPYLNIDAGYSVRKAPLAAVGESSLTFVYTVVEGDFNVDLDLLEGSAGLQLNGSAIYSAADTLLQEADLTLPAIEEEGSLSYAHDIFVTDEVPYVLAVRGVSDDGLYTAGDSVEIAVDFSLKVQAEGSPYVELATGEARLLWNVVAAPVDGNYSVVRFPGSHGLSTADSRGLQFLVGDQLMTVAAVDGDRVTMEERWAGPNITLSQPLTHIYAPAKRPAYYSSGSGTTELHFIYEVQPGDAALDLDVYNKTGLKEGHGFLYRASTTPHVTPTLDLPDPGSVTSLATDAAYVINTAVPSIVNVTTTKPGSGDALYGLGDLIELWVTFSLPVVVAGDAGQPSLALAVSDLPIYDRGAASPGAAFYVSGSGTDTLLLLYEVGEDDQSLDLAYAAYEALDPAYGNSLATVRRLAETPVLDANMSLPVLARVGTQGAIRVNGSAPRVVSVTSDTPAEDGPYGEGEEIDVTLSFSGSVVVTGAPRVLMTTGSYAVYDSGSGSSALHFVYTVAAGDDDAAFGLRTATDDYTNTTVVDLDAGTATVVAAYDGVTPAALSLPATPSLGGGIALTSAPPVVASVWSEKPAGTYGAGENISVAVTFDRPVVVTGTPVLELDLGDVDYNATLASVDLDTNLTLWFHYVVLEGHGSSDLDCTSEVSLRLPSAAADTILLRTANPALAADLTLPTRGQVGSLAWGSDIVVDTHVPYIVSLSASDTEAGLASYTQVLEVVSSSALIVDGELRLGLGPHLQTPCLPFNSTAAALQARLEDAFNTTVRVERRAANFRADGAEYHITFTHSGRVAPPALELLPNDDEVQCADFRCDDGTDCSALAVQPGLSAPQPGVVEFVAQLSAVTRVDVPGANPVLLLSNGGYAELAPHGGGRVQVIDVGVTASEPMTFGQYRLSYGGTAAPTGCIAFDDGPGVGPLSLEAALLELPEVRLLGLSAVETQPQGNGYRHTVTFASGAPLALYVVEGGAVCRDPVPADARAERPATDELRFHYFVEAGDDAAALQVANASALVLRGAVMRRNSTQPLTHLDTASVPDLDQTVRVDTTAAPTVERVNCTSPGGSYGAGSLLTFVVHMSAPVQVEEDCADLPLLQLAMDGPVVGRARWDDTQPHLTDALRFVYEVEDGAATQALDVAVGDMALYRSGCTVTAAAAAPAVDANLTVVDSLESEPLPIVLNTTAPRVVSVATTTPTGVYGEGQVIDIDVQLSRPVAVRGDPVLALNVGRNASLTLGGQVQFLDVGVDASAPVVDGEFLVEYGDERTDCVRWNSTSDLLSKITALEGLPIADVDSVTATPEGNGLRFRIAFADGTNPEPLEPVLNPYLCARGAFEPSDVTVARPHMTTLTFRYVVQQWDFAEQLDVLALTPGEYVRHWTDRPTTDADLTLPAAGLLGAGAPRVTVNGSTPTVADVYSVSGEGPFGPGDVVQLAVQLSAPVVVVGTPLLELDTGGPSLNASAAFVGGTTTSKLLFEFTVADLDDAADLDYISPHSLVLPDGASVTRLSSTPTAGLLLELPAPGSSGSISAEQDVVLARDAQPQILSVTSPTENGVYGAGEEIFIDLELARPVVVASANGAGPVLVLNVPRSNASFSGPWDEAATTLRFLYTVHALDDAETLDVESVALVNGSTIEAYSTPGVFADTTLTTSLAHWRNITIDSSAAFVTGVEAETPDGYYGMGQEVVLRVLWSAPVSIVSGGPPRLRLEDGNAPHFSAYAEYDSGSGTAVHTFKYVVAYGDRASPLEYDGTGALREELQGADLRRTSTNPEAPVDDRLPDPRNELATRSQVFVNYALTPRATALTTDASTTYEFARGEQVVLTLSFDHAVVVVGEPFITLHVSDADPALTAQAVYLSGSGSTELLFGYTVQASHKTLALRYADTRQRATQTYSEPVDTNSGTIRLVSTTPTTDAVLRLPVPGEAGSLSNVSAIMVDGSTPEVLAVWTDEADRAYGAGEVISVYVNYSDPVDVHGDPIIAMDTGTLTDTNAVYVSGSGSDVLLFEYVVERGDQSDLLDYKDADSLRMWTSNRERAYDDTARITRAASDLPASVRLPAPGPRASVVAPSSLEGSGHALVVETGDLTISEVTADQADGVYGVGEELVINVQFLADVEVSGSPYVELVVGQAAFASASGSVVSFTYLVADGDDVDLLDYESTRSLVLPGSSSIVGADAGTPATVTLPDIGSQGSLGRTRAISIDTSAPNVTAVTSTSTAAGSTVGVGESIALSVHWTAPVVVEGWWPYLELNTGGRANYTSGSGSTELVFTYLVLEGHSSGGAEDGGLDVANASSLVGVLRRESTNPTTRANAALPVGSLPASALIVVDTTAPTVTDVTSYSRPNVLISGATLELVVTFSAPVVVPAGGDLPALELEVGARAQASAVYLSGNGTAQLVLLYTTSAADGSSDLDYAASTALSGSVLRLSTWSQQPAVLTLPLPGRAHSLGLNADLVVFGDATRPVRVSSLSPDGTYASGDTLSLVVTFSRAVEVSSDATLALDVGRDSGALSGLASDALELAQNHTFSFLVLNGDMAARLDYDGVEAFSSDTLRDLNGNVVAYDLPEPGSGASLANTAALVVDTTPPAVTSVDSSAATTVIGHGAGEYLLFSVTFSLDVVVMDLDAVPCELLLDTGAGEARVASYLSGNETATLWFEYTVLEGDGTRDVQTWDESALSGSILRLSELPATAAVLDLPVGDAAGSLLTNANVRLDTSTPYVESVMALNEDGEYMTGDVVYVGVQFSAPVTVTGTPTLALDVGEAEFYGTGLPVLEAAADRTVVFNLTVQSGFLSEGVTHASQTALSLNSGTATIRRSSTTPTTDSDLLLPALHDSTERLRPFRYVRGVEVVLRGLYHEHAADLGVTLSHAGRECELVAPGSGGARELGFPTSYAYPDPQLYDPPPLEGAGVDLWLADRAGPNLALLGQASQISTAFGGDAARAIDGDTNPFYSGDSVTHTGPASGEVGTEPWWQVRLDEESTVGSVVVWNRALQPSQDEVQTLHTFCVYSRLRIRGGHVNVTVESRGSNETATYLPWDASAAELEERFEELANVGDVTVTRSDSPRTSGGYVWTVTFLDERENLPLMQSSAALDVAGAFSETATVRNGNDNEWYRYKRQGVDVAGRLAPAWVMLFDDAADMDALGALVDARRAAVWQEQISVAHGYHEFTLPRDTTGRILRVQLDSSNYLHLAEVQVFGARRETLGAFNSNQEALFAPRAVEPYQPNEPLGECFTGHAFDGPWVLSVWDAEARSVDNSTAALPFAEHGGGGLSDWVLLLVDLAGRQHEFRMDRYVSVSTLPKFGTLLADGADGEPGEPIEARSQLRRQMEICYGALGAGEGSPRYCADNFGVGVPVRPRRLGSGTLRNEQRASNYVHYQPHAGYVGADQFAFAVTNGVDTTDVADRGRVRVQVRDCRAHAQPVETPDALCACSQDRTAPAFNATACVEAVRDACASRPADFAALCEVCDDPEYAGQEMGVCVTYARRAYDEAERRELCATPEVPRCEGDWMNAAREREPFLLL